MSNVIEAAKARNRVLQARLNALETKADTAADAAWQVYEMLSDGHHDITCKFIGGDGEGCFACRAQAILGPVMQPLKAGEPAVK